MYFVAAGQILSQDWIFSSGSNTSLYFEVQEVYRWSRSDPVPRLDVFPGSDVSFYLRIQGGILLESAITCPKTGFFHPVQIPPCILPYREVLRWSQPVSVPGLDYFPGSDTSLLYFKMQGGILVEPSRLCPRTGCFPQFKYPPCILKWMAVCCWSRPDPVPGLGFFGLNISVYLKIQGGISVERPDPVPGLDFLPGSNTSLYFKIQGSILLEPARPRPRIGFFPQFKNLPI